MSLVPRILLVDDEPDLTELVAYNLRREGYTIDIARDGRTALRLAEAHRPDMVVLDVMMPGLDGLEVAQRLRALPGGASVPIVMLTARADERDELRGLEAGADDYITKPFSMAVLVARVRSVLRRSSRPLGHSAPGTLELGPIRVDIETHQATVDGQPMTLTVTEFKLLAALLSADGKVLSRPALISRAMGPGVTVTERTIDVHVTSIRKKLSDAAPLIQTVRGVGYRAAVPEGQPEQTADA